MELVVSCVARRISEIRTTVYHPRRDEPEDIGHHGKGSCVRLVDIADLNLQHEVTLPEDTSQFPQLKPTMVPEPSQLSLSMSSLIDFESEDMEMIEEPDVVVDQRPQTQEDARKEMLLEVGPVETHLQSVANLCNRKQKPSEPDFNSPSTRSNPTKSQLHSHDYRLPSNDRHRQNQRSYPHHQDPALPSDRLRASTALFSPLKPKLLSLVLELLWRPSPPFDLCPASLYPP